MPGDGWGFTPFKEAIDYFRQKVNLPSEKWTDLEGEMHSRAFTVAGAVKDALLCDLRAAIDQAMSRGMSLKDFQKEFDDIVARHGWSYRGGRNWRTAVIFNTNMRTAYMAGRYKQMTDPQVMSKRPYWLYRHGGSARPRPEHLAWDGLVLSADDPWWETHYPPNGFNCSCRVFALSAGDLQGMGKSGPDHAPEDPVYEWTDPQTGEVLSLYKGVDPGWDYNVGQSSWGKRVSAKVMDAWRAQGARAWEPLTGGSWESAGRPQTMPADPPRAKPGPECTSVAAAAAALEDILGAKERVYSVQAGAFTHHILVNADTLAEHVDLNRTPFLPYLPETMNDPYEVWLSFERHRGTGKVVLRQRIIKVLQLNKKEGFVFVVQANGGMLETWTVFGTSRPGYVNRQRKGQLIYGR